MTLVSHFASLLATAIVVCGPIPLGLSLVDRAAREGGALTLPQRIVMSIAVWCAAQMAIALLLGIAGAIHLTELLITETVVFGAGAALVARGRWTRTAQRWRAAAPRLGPVEIGIALAASTLGLKLLWECVAHPVIDWDSWSFHLPAIARFVQSGSLVRLEQYAGRGRVSYPYGWEAMCSLMVLPFGEDFLITLPNVLAWALLGGSAYVLARSFGAARVHAMGTATLLLATPVIVVHVNTMHVDLPFASFIVFALAAARVHALRPSPIWLSAAVVACGAALALRPTASLYIPVVAAAALLHPRHERRQIRSYAPIAVAIVLAGALSGYWYIRNVVELGNPVGRINVIYGTSNGGIGTLIGLARSALLFTFDWTQLASWRDIFSRTRGELAAPFAVCALLAFGCVAVVHRRRRPRGPRPWGAIGLTAATAFLFWATPTSALSGAQVRLGIAFLGCLAATAAVGATAARLPGIAMAALALLIVGVTCAASSSFYIALAAIAVLGALQSQPRVVRRAAVGAVSILALVGTVAARHWRAELRPRFYGEIYAYLDREVPPGEPLAYFFTERSYFLYGTSLQRPLHYAPLAPGDDPEAWLADLDERGIRLVVVGPSPDSQADVTERLDPLIAPKGRLVPIHGGDRRSEATVYRVSPPD